MVLNASNIIPYNVKRKAYKIDKNTNNLDKTGHMILSSSYFNNIAFNKTIDWMHIYIRADTQWHTSASCGSEYLKRQKVSTWSL